MNITQSFILYLVFFRLAIIAAGVISIILGYRLFIAGVWPKIGSGEGESVEAKFAGSSITLKNAAPGTCFALFGLLIISFMFVRGGPELTLKAVGEAGQIENKINENTQGADYMEVTLRDFSVSYISHIDLEYKDGFLTAEQAYSKLYEYVINKGIGKPDDKVKK